MPTPPPYPANLGPRGKQQQPLLGCPLLALENLKARERLGSTQFPRRQALLSFSLPQRPRQHVLETENERAFRAALPAEWVVRRIDPDYGIDLTVEIFQDGRSTALSFNVQLKATDEEDVSKALRSIRFSRELANYYWQQPMPVLIVRYQAATQELYARWWHAYNPLVAARPDETDPQSEPSRTVGFVFSEHDRWDPQTPERLVDGVLGFRRFRSPDLSLPITFNLSGRRDADEDDVTRQLLSLRDLIEPLAGVVAVRRGAPGANTPYITIGGNASTVALADVASITLDITGEPPTDEQTVANLACAIAMVLVTVGQPNLAAQVAEVAAARSTLITGMHVAFTLAGAFFRSQRITEVLDVIDELNERADLDSRVAAFVLWSAVLARGSALTPAEHERIIEVSRAALERTLASGDKHAAASDAYNLGKALARTGAWARALPAFKQAVELDPHYGEHAYFLRDMAVALFESGEFDAAADVAGEAFHLDPQPHIEVLVADALMNAGRYAEAHDRFAVYLTRSPDHPADAIWRLKHRILAEVRALVGDVQERRPAEAYELAQRVEWFDDDPGAVDRAWTQIDQALHVDGLCGAIHYVRSMLSSEDKRGDGVGVSDAVGPAICAAVLETWDAGWWANAIWIATTHGEPDSVVYDLMRCGLFKTGQDLINDLLAADTPPLKPQHIRLLDEAAQDLAEERSAVGFTLRARTPDGDPTVEFVFERQPQTS